MASGHLYVISAPSGAGKTSLVKALLDRLDGINASVSYTTRPIRPGEVDGKDYHFVSKERFLTMRDNNDFLEYAEVFGNFYGTSHQGMKSQIADGDDVILEIDWQGAEQVKKLIPEAIGIFILPPSKKTLSERLKSRGQDSDEVIARRTQEAITEMTHYSEFDYLIINDVFEDALSEIQSVIISKRLKTQQQQEIHETLIHELLE